MLYAQNRLGKLSDIQRVFKNGRSFYIGNLGLRSARNQKNVSRFTVVVSTKVSKKAVDRNKLKRRLREIIRKEILPSINQGYDIMVMTKKDLLKKSFEDLKKDAIELFKKARLL
jgi:ribonuclease P protein component